MRAFMTNGTLDYLEKVTSAYPSLHIYFMHNGSGTLAYYESNENNIFGGGRTYEIVLSTGKIHQIGYVVMNNIPLTEEGEPIFIDKFRQGVDQIRLMPGFRALRLLKSDKINTYVVFTQWDTKANFESWKGSDDFMNSYNHREIKQPAYFAARPFSVNYMMIDYEQSS